MHKGEGPEKPKPRLVRQADVWRLVGFGWAFAASVVLGLLAGLWLDKVVDSSPAFTLVGMFLGLAAGFYGMFKMLMPLYYRERDRQSRGPGDNR